MSKTYEDFLESQSAMEQGLVHYWQARTLVEDYLAARDADKTQPSMKSSAQLRHEAESLLKLSRSYLNRTGIPQLQHLVERFEHLVAELFPS